MSSKQKQTLKDEIFESLEKELLHKISKKFPNQQICFNDLKGIFESGISSLIKDKKRQNPTKTELEILKGFKAKCGALNG